jgi:hypothetical protein
LTAVSGDFESDIVDMNNLNILVCLRKIRRLLYDDFSFSNINIAINIPAILSKDLFIQHYLFTMELMFTSSRD